MRLPHSNTAIYEQRVVRFRGYVSDGLRGSVRELIAGSDDKAVEGELRIQADRWGEERLRFFIGGSPGGRRGDDLVDDLTNWKVQFADSRPDLSGILLLHPLLRGFIRDNDPRQGPLDPMQGGF